MTDRGSSSGARAAAAAAGEPGRPKPTRRRRLVKIALYVVGGLAALIVLAAILFPLIFTEARLKGMFCSYAGAALKRKVSVESLDLDLFSGVKVGGLRIANREGFSAEDFIRVKELDVRVNVLSALASLGRKVHARVAIAEPRVLIERGAGWVLNIADLLKPEPEKQELGSESERKETEPLKELSLEFKWDGGRLLFRDCLGDTRRETMLKDLTAEANLPGLARPLRYRVTGNASKGSFLMKGNARLFHNGTIEPRQVMGELLSATLTRFPLGGICGTLGLPATVESVNGEISVSAERAGQVTAVGNLTGDTVFDGLTFAADLSSSMDIPGRDLSARITFKAEPFSEGEFSLEMKDAGAESFLGSLNFTCDLAKLTGGAAAKSLGMPTPPDGGPATSRGSITGRLKISGTSAALNGRVSISIADFQAHPSLTGGSTLPPEDTALSAEAGLQFTPEGKLKELAIGSLEAKSSFLDARIVKGRVWSLSDLNSLGTDLSGYVRFSGRTFTSKFGKALGLPPLHDKLELKFSGKGEEGHAKVAAAAKLEREQGKPAPVRFSVAARLDARGAKIDARDCKVMLTAGEAEMPYTQVALIGSFSDLTGAPEAELSFSGTADLGALASRLSAYIDVLSEIKPQGQMAVADGSFSGTARKFRTKFKLAAKNLSIAGRSDPPQAGRAAAPVLDILSKGELVCQCDASADLAKKQVEIKTLDFKSSDLAASVSGTIDDYVALKGAVEVRLAAKTNKFGPLLAALKLIPEGIDTKGRLELAGRLDTGKGELELDNLEANTAYGRVTLKEQCTVSGLDIDKFRTEPLAAARKLSASASFEGVVFLDSLATLPEGLLPPQLKATGAVPFTLNVEQASPTKIAFSADATAASLEYGEFFAKPRAKKATVELGAALAENGGVDVSRLDVLLDGAELRLNGQVSDDFGTFVCQKLTAVIERPAMLTAMVPALREFELSGKLHLSASGRVPIDEVTAGSLGGAEFSGVVRLDQLAATSGRLGFTANGEIRMNRNSIDAAGLTVGASTRAPKSDTTLTFKELRITAAKKNAPILAHTDALHLAFSVSSPHVNAGHLLAALPEKANPGVRETTTAPSARTQFEFLKNHTVTGHLEVEKLTYEKHIVKNISTDLRMAGNKITTSKPFRAEVHQGTVRASLAADLNQPGIAHNGEIVIQKIDLNNVATAQLSLKDVFMGRVGGDVTWKGKGFAWDDITTNWTADMKFALNDGVILNFERSPLVAGLAGPILRHLGAAALPDNKYRYDQLDLDLHLRRGRVHADDLLLEGRNNLDLEIQKASVGLDGTIQMDVAVMAPTELLMNYVKREVVKQEAALAVVEKALEKKRPAFCTFGVSGRFDKPRIAADLTTFPKWVLSLVTDILRDPRSLIEGILKDRLKQHRDRDEKKEKKDEPADALKGLLRDLLH